MKLLFYTPQFLPSIGGLQNVVNAWAEELSTMGWQIVIITDTPSKEPGSFNFKVIRHASFYRKVKEMRECDMVIMFNVSLKAIPHWILSRRPLLVNHQTALFYPGKKRPWQQLAKKWVADHLASINISCSKYIAGIYKQSEVVPNPFDDRLFRNQHTPIRDKCFLFIGRLVSDKGCDLLIQAFKIVTEKIAGSFSLTIIGTGPDKEMLENMAVSLGLQNRVIFKGAITGNSLVREMNSHKIMIVPSRMEPFGIVVLEGLACGCQMIISNTGGLPEAAGGLASVFESENVRELAECMIMKLNGNAMPDEKQINDHLNRHSVKFTAGELVNIIKQKTMHS